MESALIALGICGVGLVIAAGTVVWLVRLNRGLRRASVEDQVADALADGLQRVLSVLPGAAFVVGPDSSVLLSSPQARSMSLVVGDRVQRSEISALIASVRRDGRTREQSFDLSRPPVSGGAIPVQVRVASLADDSCLVLVEDMSQAARIDAVRRDFVANVSHELKTPVGALSLLAEAVEAASDEPPEVRHFATRMRAEAQRLSNLVQDLIDLSRLQGADEPLSPRDLDVGRVVAEAVDATRLTASARGIELVVAPADRLLVTGDDHQLAMALRNLLTNAIAYSPANTKVVVAARPVVMRGTEETMIEISVTDQGIGIPRQEQDRIFERFYRVDPARSRQTGGTGLGLAIVKHVCANHGGECTVWSVPGEGSTFTLRLPAASALIAEPDAETSADGMAFDTAPLPA